MCSQRWKSSIQSAKTRLGADYGSDHELLIAKFILKLKKVGKTTRPFGYDLNQIPYDYTVEVNTIIKLLFKQYPHKLKLVNYHIIYRKIFLKKKTQKMNKNWKGIIGKQLYNLWWWILRDQRKYFMIQQKQVLKII